MLLYYPFWMFMGFILHIYVSFGTNLLTGGPTRIAVFFAYFSISKKRNIKWSPNGMNLRELDFWNERDPEDLECKPRSSRGGQDIGGCAPYLVGPSGVHRRTSSSYISLRTPETIREPTKHNFHIVTFYIREISAWSLRRHSAGGGIDHRGLLHQHPCPSDEL